MCINVLNLVGVLNDYNKKKSNYTHVGLKNYFLPHQSEPGAGKKSWTHFYVIHLDRLVCSMLFSIRMSVEWGSVGWCDGPG